VFMDSTCNFCDLQYPVTARFAETHGLLTTYISMDGSRLASMPEDVPVVRDEGQSKHLQINVFPATALVIPPDQIIVISQGLLSDDLIEERVIAAAASAGLVPDEIRHAIFPMER